MRNICLLFSYLSVGSYKSMVCRRLDAVVVLYRSLACASALSLKESLIPTFDHGLRVGCSLAHWSQYRSGLNKKKCSDLFGLGLERSNAQNLLGALCFHHTQLVRRRGPLAPSLFVITARRTRQDMWWCST